VVVAAAIATAAAVSHYWKRHYKKVKRNDSALTGHQFMQEQLRGHPEVFYDNFGMHKHVFHRLLKALKEKTGFTDSKHVSAIEQLGIFLYAVITGLSVRNWRTGSKGAKIQLQCL